MRLACLALALALVGCAGHVTTELDYVKPDTKAKVIALAEPVFLADLDGAVQPDVEPVWTGTFVGNIVFAGGFEVVEREGGLENVSVNVETSGQERYRRQIVDVTRGCVSDALGREGRDWFSTGLSTPAPTPTRRDVRGTGKLDGRDNQPLPRFTLAATPWEGGAPVPDGADALLVPYIVHYYAHNGGWFLGQTYGSAGGARTRVFWALYEPDGRAVGWSDHGARTEEHGRFSPNSQEIQDYLIDVEEALCRSLGKKVP